jgi:hypothetical protein
MSEVLQERVRHEPEQILSATAFRMAADEGEPARDLGYEMVENYEEDEREDADASLRRMVLLISGPFERRPAFPQRWNTSFPCFYSALEPATAIAEMLHHCWQRFFSCTTVSAVHYVQFSVIFEGKVIDIRNWAEEFPSLCEDEHNGDCHAIAEAARARLVDGILARSVRRREGTCLPVYSRSSLRPCAFEEKIVFRRQPGSGAIEVERLSLLDASESPWSTDS